MKKRLEVHWSHEALLRVDKIIMFLEEHWTSREIIAFLRALRRFERLVAISPFIYPVSELKQGCRRAVISKQISVLYSIDESIVKIHSVFDNRQDPEKAG